MPPLTTTLAAFASCWEIVRPTLPKTATRVEHVGCAAADVGARAAQHQRRRGIVRDSRMRLRECPGDGDAVRRGHFKGAAGKERPLREISGAAEGAPPVSLKLHGHWRRPVEASSGFGWIAAQHATTGVTAKPRPWCSVDGSRNCTFELRYISPTPRKTGPPGSFTW